MEQLVTKSSDDFGGIEKDVRHDCMNKDMTSHTEDGGHQPGHRDGMSDARIDLLDSINKSKL